MNVISKTFFVISAALLALYAGIQLAKADNEFTSIGNSVYKLYTSEKADCSAVAVSKDQLVTAAHCVTGQEPLSIRIDNEAWNAQGTRVLNSSTVHFVDRVRVLASKDVAFLELKDDSVELKPTKICDEDELEFGDRVYAVGFPKVLDKTITEGLFTAKTILPIPSLEGPFYRTSVPIAGGNSGGGLFTFGENKDLCLTGITSAMNTQVSFMSFFSPLSSLKEVTKSLLNTEEKKADIAPFSSSVKEVINPSDDR